MNIETIKLAKEVVENVAVERGLKQLAEDYNIFAGITGAKTIKKFASKSAGQARLIKIANEVLEAHGDILVEKTEEEPTAPATGRGGKPLIVRVNGVDFKYSEMKVGDVRGAETIEYPAKQPSPNQLDWIESAWASNGAGSSRQALTFDIDGVEKKWSDAKNSDFKNATTIKIVAGTPTEKQTDWLNKNSIKIVDNS